jgi:ankyrin repeat protein
MSQDKSQNPELSAVFEKMANTPSFQGRKPKSLHDRGLDDNTSLHVAVLNGDLDAGKILLEAGANPNAPGESGDTPLHIAIRQKNCDFVRLLLSFAASKECENDDNLSPADLVKRLNDSGLNTIFPSCLTNQEQPQNSELTAILEEMSDLPNFLGVKLSNVCDRGVQGDTPLHIAAIRGDLKIGKLLLDAGANPNLPGDYWNTPLHIAVEKKNYEFGKLLLEHGASKEIPNRYGLSPADYVQRSNDARLIELFSSFQTSHDTSRNLKLAAVLDEMEMAELSDLPKKLTSVNSRGILGDTPLHVAEVWGVETGKILLEAGANPNLPGEYDNTPLHNAVVGKKYDFVELLLKYGASKDLRNEDGFSPTDFVRQANDPRLTELFSSLPAK